MKRFAQLYLRLEETRSRDGKAAALDDFFAACWRQVHAAPFPEAQQAGAEAAWAVHFLSGGRVGPRLPGRLLRTWAVERVGIPEWLLDTCRDEVGDLAETLARVSAAPSAPCDPTLPQAVQCWLRPLAECARDERYGIVRSAWDALGFAERTVLHRLLMGLRAPVQAAAVAQSVARTASVDASVVAGRMAAGWRPWATGPPRHTALPPRDSHAALREASDAFARLTAPALPGEPRAHPFHALAALEGEPEALGEPRDWLAEWDREGDRVQLIRCGARTVLWSADGRLAHTAPDVALAGAALPDGTVLDGILLATPDEGPLRKAGPTRHQSERQPSLFPDRSTAFVAIDLIELGGADWRARPLHERRVALESLATRFASGAIQLSPALCATGWTELRGALADARTRGARGILLRRRADAYGAPTVWLRWASPPLRIRAVLVGAQRGTGARADAYDEYAFGVWHGAELVPVTRIGHALPRAAEGTLAAFARQNTVRRAGAWRELNPRLVCEIEFESVSRASRRRSGLELTGARIARALPGAEPECASTLADLATLMVAGRRRTERGRAR